MTEYKKDRVWVSIPTGGLVHQRGKEIAAFEQWTGANCAAGDYCAKFSKVNGGSIYLSEPDVRNRIQYPGINPEDQNIYNNALGSYPKTP